MILVVDNYDSFTFNLVQYLGELGAEPTVRRNDEMSPSDLNALDPAAIVISPGPGRPVNAGISVELIRSCVGRIPVLGVCLGHQALAEAFGGRVVRADRLMHGKASPVVHTGQGIFQRLPSPLTGMRYHSLLVERASLPPSLFVTAWTEDRETEVMGLQHADAPLFGVQFHPESIGTATGKRLMQNFLEIVKDRSRTIPGLAI